MIANFIKQNLKYNLPDKKHNNNILKYYHQSE